MFSFDGCIVVYIEQIEDSWKDEKMAILYYDAYCKMSSI